MAPTPGRYLRIDIDDTSHAGVETEPVSVGDSDDVPELTFIDLYTSLRKPYDRAYTERMTEAIQDRLHLILRTEYMMFRWPWLAGPNEKEHGSTHHALEINEWIARLVVSDRGAPVIPSSFQVGVLQHRVAGSPSVEWNRSKPNDEDGLLRSARDIELQALLRRSNAIWEPNAYHYELPSGEHTDVFIRVADAIQCPQDAYAITTWLTDRFVDGAGIIVDTGSLTPILIQAESFMTRFNRRIGVTAILSEYPVGRPMIRLTVDNAASAPSPKIVGVLSVNSTGTLLATLLDELEAAEATLGINFTLDVLVDRMPNNSKLGTSDPRIDSWSVHSRSSESRLSSTCRLCISPEKAQYVSIDPRTYGAMSLPGPYLVMPDIKYAARNQLFWRRVAESRGRAIETNPHPGSRIARGKRTALPVRPLFDLICQTEGLEELVMEGSKNVEIPDEFRQTALIITVDRDINRVRLPSFATAGEVDFKASLRAVLIGIGLRPDLPIVTTSNTSELRNRIASLNESEAILIFTWGSVTGLTVRHLKVTIAEELHLQGKDMQVNGLVFHSRPSTPAEWTALQNQFGSGSLVCLWTSCFPWTSPLSEEYRLLDRAGLNNIDLPGEAEKFLHLREQFLSFHSTYSEYDDDWSPRFEAGDAGPHPEHVLWGMTRGGAHQARVRGRSLYGRELDCLTAYAAIGAVINFTRLDSTPRAAPRWVMFDLGRIVRSYFDAVIVCSMLRWLNPGELWWGTEKEATDSVTFLLDQAETQEEQVLLIPELLLASAQGKVPTAAHESVRQHARAMLNEWPDDEAFDTPRGAVQLGLALLDGG